MPQTKNPGSAATEPGATRETTKPDNTRVETLGQFCAADSGPVLSEAHRRMLEIESGITGAVIELTSMAPFAPVFKTATDASAPPDQPGDCRNLSNPSCVMNRKPINFDWAPICNPTDTVAR